MTTDLDLDDVAADHPLAMRELAALRRVSDAAHLVHDAAHEITSDSGLVCFVARKHFAAPGDAIAAMRDEQALPHMVAGVAARRNRKPSP